MSREEWEKVKDRSFKPTDLMRVSIRARAGPGTPRLPGTSGVPANPPYASVSAIEEAPSSLSLEHDAAPPASQPSSPLGKPPASGASRPSSVLGLPVLSCYSSGYRAWSFFMLLLDLTWSAYLLPLSIGFHVRKGDANRCLRPCLPVLLLLLVCSNCHPTAIA